MAENTTVAVLGTGNMGAGIARNLLAAGMEVRAWNTSSGKRRTSGEDVSCFPTWVYTADFAQNKLIW